MKKKCIEFPTADFLNNLEEFKNKNIKIYIDTGIIKDILEILKKESYKKKFRRILYTIFSGDNNTHLYGREDVSGKAKDITAMKFTGKENLRIYCKEFSKSGKKIVMITHLSKKVQSASNLKIKSVLEAIGGYEYDFK
jgi:hypothetical protein